MVYAPVQDSFRRRLAAKSRYPGHFDYGYTHGLGEKEPKINVIKNEFMNSFRQRQVTSWLPSNRPEQVKPTEISCYAIHHLHVGHLPNYGGHIPGGKFRFGRTFGEDTKDAKRWLRGDYRPN